jgi:hypothetical protein
VTLRSYAEPAPPVVRVGRVYGASVSLTSAVNISHPSPLERNFEFWPLETDLAVVQAVVSGKTDAIVFNQPSSSLLILEGRMDRCSSESSPLAISSWVLNHAGYGGSGTAELALPLLPLGHAWCLTARINGSAFLVGSPATPTTQPTSTPMARISALTSTSSRQITSSAPVGTSWRASANLTNATISETPSPQMTTTHYIPTAAAAATTMATTSPAAYPSATSVPEIQFPEVQFRLQVCSECSAQLFSF